MSKNGKKIMARKEAEAASKAAQSETSEKSALKITFKGIDIVYEPDMGLEDNQLAIIRPFTEDEKWRLENGEAVIRRIGDKVYLDQRVRIKEGRPSLVLKFMEAEDIGVVGIDPGSHEGSKQSDMLVVNNSSWFNEEQVKEAKERLGQPVFKTDDGEVTLEEAERIPSLWTPDDPEKAEAPEEIRGGKIRSPWFDFKSTPMLNPGPFSGCFERASNLSKDEIIAKMRKAISKTKFISPNENVCDCCGEEDLTKETTHGEEAAELPPVHEGGTEGSGTETGRGDPA